MSDKENYKEAKQQLKDRVADLAWFNKLSDEWDDQPTKQDQVILDRLGSPNEYGLSIEKDSYSYRLEEYTWRYVLSTGGPHEEINFSADKYGGDLSRLKFVSLPWFGRVELDFNVNQEETVKNFIERFLYLEVQEDEGMVR